MTTKKATPKKAAKTKSGKAPKKGVAPKTKKADGKLSQLDAAAKVLAASSEPKNCPELVKAMTEKGLWTSPGGKTPESTLYSSILREIKTKGKEARFVKTDRGRFTLAK